MIKFRALFLCAALSLPLLAGNVGAAPLPTGKSDFIFEDPPSNPGKPLTAWVYKPAQATRDSRVVFVMTGVQRNAMEYRENWIRHAERHGFILVVPEFSRRHYPVDNDYTFGGVTQANRDHWGFSTLERLFDEVRQRDELSAVRYTIYGHSAGGQFVHRLVLFLGETARLDTAIAANSGWYSLPLHGEGPLFRFPLALDPHITPEKSLPALFSRRLVLMLGDQDIDSAHKSLNRTPPAMTQGEHRFARGHFFYRLAKAQADMRNLPFNWKLVTVPGVAHSDKGMSDAAVKYLFEE